MRFWIDLETSGLHPTKDCILEIAVFITDDRLENFIEGPSLVVNPVGNGFDNMDPFVVDMHTKNGLLDDIKAGKGIRRYEAEQKVIDFALACSSLEVLKKTPLAGSTVHFDRAFLKEHMPQLEELFGYRNYDVSTLKMHFESMYPGLTVPRPPAHRAMADILESLAAARFLRDWRPVDIKAA